MKFLLPKQQIFFDLLKNLNLSLSEMASLFGEFAADFGNFGNYAERAKAIEHEADACAHKIIDRLNQTFITPFDREDIYVLTEALDNIVDLIENVVQNIDIYGITKKRAALDEFAAIIGENAAALEALMAEFEKQKLSPAFCEARVKIHDLEDQGDEIFKNSLSVLFKEEKDPVEIIKWKDILENLERVMDEFQNVSNILENIIVKSN